MSEARIDPVTLTARKWAAQDAIVRSARVLVRRHDLDSSYLERLESAALHGAGSEFESVLADLLEAVVAARS